MLTFNLIYSDCCLVQVDTKLQLFFKHYSVYPPESVIICFTSFQSTSSSVKKEKKEKNRK